jgi:Clp amino terminal domain, pathogenicity island component
MFRDGSADDRPTDSAGVELRHSRPMRGGRFRPLLSPDLGRVPGRLGARAFTFPTALVGLSRWRRRSGPPAPTRDERFATHAITPSGSTRRSHSGTALAPSLEMAAVRRQPGADQDSVSLRRATRSVVLWPVASESSMGRSRGSGLPALGWTWRRTIASTAMADRAVRCWARGSAWLRKGGARGRVRGSSLPHLRGYRHVRKRRARIDGTGTSRAVQSLPTLPAIFGPPITWGRWGRGRCAGWLYPWLARRVLAGDEGTIDLVPGPGMVGCICESHQRFGRLSGATGTSCCRDGVGFISGGGGQTTFVGVLSTRVRELRVVDASGQITIAPVNDDDAYWVTVENAVQTIKARTDGTMSTFALNAFRNPAPTRHLGAIIPRLTEATSEVLAVARREARRLGTPYVGIEHLLLALLGQHSDAFRAVGIDVQRVQVELLDYVKVGENSLTDDAEVPFTPRAFRVLNAACDDADRRRTRGVEPADLVRALVLGAGGLAMELVRGLGVTDRQLLDALDRQN